MSSAIVAGKSGEILNDAGVIVGFIGEGAKTWAKSNLPGDTPHAYTYGVFIHDWVETGKIDDKSAAEVSSLIKPRESGKSGGFQKVALPVATRDELGKLLSEHFAAIKLVAVASDGSEIVIVQDALPQDKESSPALPPGMHPFSKGQWNGKEVENGGSFGYSIRDVSGRNLSLKFKRDGKEIALPISLNLDCKITNSKQLPR